jgi:hypothetical protein
MNTTNANTTNTSNSFNWSDFSTLINNMDKSTNPNGFNNHVVRLDNMVAGELIIMKQLKPGTKPVEVGRMSFNGIENRLSLDINFKGIVVGKPKNPNKKFEIVYVGFTPEEQKSLSELEEKVNRK